MTYILNGREVITVLPFPKTVGRKYDEIYYEMAKTFVERLLQINRASEDQIFYQKVRKTVGLYGLDTTNHILKNFKSTNIVENEQEALQCFNLTNEIKSLPIYLVGIVF